MTGLRKIGRKTYGVGNFSKCPVCQGEVLDTAKVCRHCATALDPNSKCPTCSGFVEDDARMCRHCGVDLNTTRFCKSCRSPIGPYVRRCRHCEAEQDWWRRSTTASVPVLSILVAAAAIFQQDISDAVYGGLMRDVQVRVTDARAEDNGDIVLSLHNGGRRFVEFGEPSGGGGVLMCDVRHGATAVAQFNIPAETGQRIPATSGADARPLRFDGLIRYSDSHSLDDKDNTDDLNELWEAFDLIRSRISQGGDGQDAGFDLDCSLDVFAPHEREGFQNETIRFALLWSSALDLALRD